MATDGTPVTYEELPAELKKKHDEIKATLEADLIGSFQNPYPWHQMEGILTTRCTRWDRSLCPVGGTHHGPGRRLTTWWLTRRHSENLVNVLERLAARDPGDHEPQYSPSGPALGTHQGELPLQSRPPLPYALATPAEVPATPAFVVYKIGGDPNDCQFLVEAPKEIPQGYACTYVPDCGNWALSNQATTSCSWLELEKQTWLAKYATPANLQSASPAASTADQISTILRDQFGIMPKRRAIVYSKPYPDEYEMIPLPPKYRLPDFSKFSGSDGSSSIEHIGRYLAQLGPARVGSTTPNSIQSWKQLEEQFHMQYHSEASDSSIADLAQLRQKRGETVTEYIQRFRNLRNRCYSVRITEKEAVELAVAGLATQLKDMASQADYPSLAHMVQKLSAYEQRHPDLYQDKFKRAVVMVDTEEIEVPAGDQEVATEQIFDLLLKEKQLTIPEGLKFPTAQELNGKPYCKFHNSLSHANDGRVWRQHIQAAIEKGRLIFNQYAMKVDTQPFPAVNMVEAIHPEGCQPGPTFSINMVGPGNHSGKDGDEGSCSHSKDTEEAAPRDRLHHDGKRYVTEGEVKNIRYQRPLSDHLLNKYVSQYDQRRRSNYDDEGDRLAREARRHRRQDRDEEEHVRRATEASREQDDNARHWDCPFFRHCWIQE
ncbi:hypothetical protein QYE76_069881 [Lolium multiflorum]|uniref:Retrotransposon gag domain-containing protein n=1 Tax=Lolium multiflorum TaxID=4521 RepID=A0AAD8SIM1_LOLMU|nr:hypothetical protein QYE76_069881 [Lolium multiflorum]